MQMNNPLQMNDWEIKKFLKFIFSIQVAMWGVIGLGYIDLQIPILRQLIAFVYLAFIPGILILRILNLHKLGNIETLLYTVGLSIAALMFTGLFMNTVYPFFGISGPISITPLIITISILVLTLCILSYVIAKDFSNPGLIDIEEVLSPPVLFLCMIPFLAIFGTYLVNFHHNNIIILFLIIIIALMAVLIGFDKLIPMNIYPMTIFIIAISLLYHRSLISMYLWGWDIQVEYYFSNLVKTNLIWNSTIPSNCNAMLSVVILAPFFSDICDMNLAWFYKILYPLLFSLVPLGLYRVFQKQIDDKIAFLSCFFFTISVYFYDWMLWLPRQGIAELFLVSLILLIIDKNIDKPKKSFLFIVFGISLAVSHYALSYIYIFCLIATWLILILAKNPAMRRLIDNFHSEFSRKREENAGNPVPIEIDRTISSTLVIIFVAFALAWYMYVSSSTAFNSIVRIGDHISNSIFTDFLNPDAAQGLHLMMGKTQSPLHYVNKIINYLNQIFIVIGCIVLLLKYRKLKFEKEYAVYSMVNLAILFAAIAVPFLASSLRMERLYHITLIFLAPFCVIGGITVLKMLSKIGRVTWTNKAASSSLKILSVFFALSLLYSSGFVYEVVEGGSSSISLNSTIDRACLNDHEALMAGWLKNTKDVDAKIYSDRVRGVLLWGIFGERHVFVVDEEERIITHIPDNVYIFLGRENVKNGTMELDKIDLNTPSTVVVIQNSALNTSLSKKSRVYNNGDAHIYF